MPQQITKRVSKNTGKVTWQVRVEVGKKPDGKPRFVIKTYEKKKDAETFRRQLLKERDEGLVTEPTKITLSEYLDHWLETIAKQRLRLSTFESYKTQLDLYVRPELGDRKLTQINPLLLQGLYASMLQDGKSPRTIRYTNAVLNTAFKQALKWRMINRNPTTHVELPRQERKEMSVLTPEEASSFLQAAEQDRLAALFDLAMSSGMRPGEYLGLRWSEVDLEAGTVTVVRTLVTGPGGAWRFAEPKTSRSRRTIPLPQGTVQALSAHKARQAEERLAAGPTWTHHDLVFTTTRGGPLNRNNLVKRNFLSTLKRAELGEWSGEGRKRRFTPKIRLYDLRHTCATLLLAAGINPKIVSERLGHASVVLTLDTYSHVLPTMQQDAVSRLDSMLYG